MSRIEGPNEEQENEESPMVDIFAWFKGIIAEDALDAGVISPTEPVIENITDDADALTDFIEILSKDNDEL